MILEIVGIILLVIILAISINTIEEIVKRNNSKISFKESMDLTELPIVTFYNKDTKLNFLLDTGSNDSHINSSILPSLEYENINRETSVIGFRGDSTENKFCKMTVFYKNQKFEDEFSIADLDEAFDVVKRESGVQIHGILGSKFFEKYRYVLDFSELIAYIK